MIWVSRRCLQGWQLNGILATQGGTRLFFYDSFNDISGTGEFNDHWNITGDPANRSSC